MTNHCLLELPELNIVCEPNHESTADISCDYLLLLTDNDRQFDIRCSAVQ